MSEHKQPKEQCGHYGICVHVVMKENCVVDKYHASCGYDTRSRPHPAPRPPCEECIYQAQAAERERKAREDFAKAIKAESPDTIQATEEDGDLHAWNAATIDRVLTQQQAGEP